MTSVLPGKTDARSRDGTRSNKWTNWPFDREAALKYGWLAAELKRSGRAMQQLDIAIAAIALTLGNCVVVSKDSDLRAVPGLTVEDWSQSE